jgi:hypothetical protein
MNLAKSIFEMQLGIMKRILKLGEFKFGKDSEQFRFYKEETMNAVYENSKKFFLQGASDGVFEKCNCGANLRHGWTECTYCCGSGYKDVKDVKKGG